MNSKDTQRQQAVSRAVVLAGLISIFGTAMAPAAQAQQYLNDPAVVVARHDTRPSREQLPRNTGERPLDAWGMLFQPSPTNIVKEDKSDLVSYEKLPNCAQSRVETHEVGAVSQLSKAMDIVYYSAEDAEQQVKAKSHKGLTVAYQPALVREPKTGIPNTLQAYARFSQVRCLPTRVRFLDVGSKHYSEIRTGTAAWQD